MWRVWVNEPRWVRLYFSILAAAGPALGAEGCKSERSFADLASAAGAAGDATAIDAGKGAAGTGDDGASDQGGRGPDLGGFDNGGKRSESGGGADTAGGARDEAGGAANEEPPLPEEICGNGVFDREEECDDGTPAGGDGCADCAVEAGWSCQGQPSKCTEQVECQGPTDCGTDAACKDGFCVHECHSGTHACGDRCDPDTAVDACGPQCRVCASPIAGSPACEADACVMLCPSARHLCDRQCFADALTAGCDELSWAGEAPSFGTTAKAVTRTFTLQNNSPSALNGLDVQLGATSTSGCQTSPAGTWSVTSTTCTAQLAAEASCEVKVKFDGALTPGAGCFTASLTATAGAAQKSLALTGDGLAYTWQHTSGTTDYDNSAPAVGSPCSTPGTTRLGSKADITGNTARYVYTFTTNPPSQGTCASGQVATATSTCYEGTTCADLQAVPAAACNIKCTAFVSGDSGCLVYYHRLKCTR